MKHKTFEHNFDTHFYSVKCTPEGAVSVLVLNVFLSSLNRDHGMDTQDLEFKFFAKRVETSYVVTATYV